MNDEPDLILYGVPFSQPVRAVMWLLILKRTPFDMVLIIPGSEGRSGSRNPAYLAKNPAGTIPCIEEPDTGFVLGEAHAILCYLSRKHGWDDVYPADDRMRARVDAYLHFHHRNVREASIGLVAPKIRKDLDIPDIVQSSARATFTRALEALDTGWLSRSRYLVGDGVTVADLAAYVEIGPDARVFHETSTTRARSRTSNAGSTTWRQSTVTTTCTSCCRRSATSRGRRHPWTRSDPRTSARWTC